MKLTEQQLEAITVRLQKSPVLCAAFLHGSAAKECLRSDSDVDVALLPRANQTINMQQRIDLATDLESLINRPFDLGILSTSNLIYAKEIIEHGRQLFTTNPFRSEQFLSNCLSMYADLQQERKEVLYAYST